jgi:Family of unknown function (DUF5309)
MAVPGQTALSYTFQAAPSNIIREDLEDFVYKISPTETPIMQAIGRKGKFKNTLHEWPVVELASPNPNNAQIEGNDLPNDPPTLALRLANYTQIMTKQKGVSSTDEAIVGAGDINKMAKQVLYGTQELKRDMESRLGANHTNVADPGAATSAARKTASIAAFLQTNVSLGTGGTAKVAIRSGATPPGSVGGGGYPATAGVLGTARPITEAIFKAVIQAIWTQGGNPKYAFVGGTTKVTISAFTGNVTRYQQQASRRLITAIDFYDSDFGRLEIVPDRFIDPALCLIIDPAYAELGWLQGMKNIPLAKTGLNDKRLVSCEWGTIVGNEKAHGMIADIG